MRVCVCVLSNDDLYNEFTFLRFQKYFCVVSTNIEVSELQGRYIAGSIKNVIGSL